MSGAHRATVSGIDIISVTRPQITRTVMLLHGFGASAEDLAPLADYLDPQRQWNWVFPNGTTTVPLGPHASGSAWFPIRMSDLEAAAMRGEAYDFADILPDGMKEAERRLISLVEHLRIGYGDLVLGGFSQGSMMALQVAINLPEDIRGLILFSGTLVNRKEWVAKLTARSGIPFLQSHGERDPVLGFLHAKRLYQALSGAGLKGEFAKFPGGHEIPLPTIQKAAHFLMGLE